MIVEIHHIQREKKTKSRPVSFVTHTHHHKPLNNCIPSFSYTLTHKCPNSLVFLEERTTTKNTNLSLSYLYIELGVRFSRINSKQKKNEEETRVRPLPRERENNSHLHTFYTHSHTLIIYTNEAPINTLTQTPVTCSLSSLNTHKRKSIK